MVCVFVLLVKSGESVRAGTPYAIPQATELTLCSQTHTTNQVAMCMDPRLRASRRGLSCGSASFFALLRRLCSVPPCAWCAELLCAFPPRHRHSLSILTSSILTQLLILILNLFMLHVHTHTAYRWRAQTAQRSGGRKPDWKEAGPYRQRS